MGRRWRQKGVRQWQRVARGRQRGTETQEVVWGEMLPGWRLRLGSEEAGLPCDVGAGDHGVEWSGVETIWQLAHLGPASLYS